MSISMDEFEQSLLRCLETSMDMWDKFHGTPWLKDHPEVVLKLALYMHDWDMHTIPPKEEP